MTKNSSAPLQKTRDMCNKARIVKCETRSRSGKLHPPQASLIINNVACSEKSYKFRDLSNSARNGISICAICEQSVTE